MGLKDRWGMLASTWLPCPRTGHGFHPTAPHSTALVTAQHLCPWSQHISRAATAASDLPWGLYITFCFWLQARAWHGSVVGVCNLCTAGRKNKSNSLSGRIFLITQVQTPGARFRVMGVCQPSQSEMLLKLCRGWGCWYRFYIRLVYLSCFNLFSCVLFSCARVCMREREGTKRGKHCQAHLATTAEKVQSLILSSQGGGSLQLTHAETSKSRLLMADSGLWDQIVQPHRLLYNMRRCVHLLCLEVSSTEIFPDKTNLSLQTKQWAEAAGQRGSAGRPDVASSRFWEPHSAILLLLHVLLHFDGAHRNAKETFFSVHLPTSSLKSYSIMEVMKKS